MTTYLDFEKPIAELESKIAELRHLPNSADVDIADEVMRLQDKVQKLLRQTYAKLTPWQRVLVARHVERPHAQRYIDRLITDYTPLAGDRAFAEDFAVVGGLGRLDGRSVVVIGQEKGDDTDSRIKHNFGMARPEGYRKAQRLMKLADRFRLPVVTLVDTPGAYPGLDAEARGQAEAIAQLDRHLPRDRRAAGQRGDRRGRLGRRAGDRLGRQGVHARELGLLGDHAGGLRLDPVALQRQGAGRGRGDEGHGAGPQEARGDRRRHPRADGRRPSRARRDDRLGRQGGRPTRWPSSATSTPTRCAASARTSSSPWARRGFDLPPEPEAASQRSRPVADPQGRHGGRRGARDARAGAALRSAGLSPLLARRAPQQRGAGRLDARGADRPRRGPDRAHEDRLGRRDAAALQRAQGGRELPHAGDAVPRPHRSRHRPRAGQRPAHHARAAPTASPTGATRPSIPLQVRDLVAWLHDALPDNHTASRRARPSRPARRRRTSGCSARATTARRSPPISACRSASRTSSIPTAATASPAPTAPTSSRRRSTPSRRR